MVINMPTQYFECQLQRATGFYIWIYSILIDSKGSGFFTELDAGTKRYIRGRAADSLEYASNCEELLGDGRSAKNLEHLKLYINDIIKMWETEAQTDKISDKNTMYNEAISIRIKLLISELENIINEAKDNTYAALFTLEKTALFHLSKNNFIDSYRCFLHLKIKWDQLKHK